MGVEDDRGRAWKAPRCAGDPDVLGGHTCLLIRGFMERLFSTLVLGDSHISMNSSVERKVSKIRLMTAII